MARMLEKSAKSAVVGISNLSLVPRSGKAELHVPGNFGAVIRSRNPESSFAP